jgi:type II restriction enzyme
VLLNLPDAGRAAYKSKSQRARIATEAWATTNLFCPSCDSPQLQPSIANTPAVDYDCASCASCFQLKAQSRPLRDRIVDAAYEPMRRAILSGRTPNLFALHYEADSWTVQNLILIPQFAFSLAALEKRKPLGPQARRAGWIGCNIVLAHIPQDARISVISHGQPITRQNVRQEYERLRPLETLSVTKRGWTLDLLTALRDLHKPEITLSEAYSFEARLQKLHPGNRHVRDKIRQQLQVLRDRDLLEFLGAGTYRLR